MSVELKIPEVGESITEVQIAEWLKAEGDTVKADEPVAVIDSEKTTLELSAPQAGRLAKILSPAGKTVRIGDVIGEIETDGAAEAKKPAETKPGPPAKSETAETTRTEKPAPKPPGTDEKKSAKSPAEEAKHKGPQSEKAEAEAGDTETVSPVTSTPAGEKADPPSESEAAKTARSEKPVPKPLATDKKEPAKPPAGESHEEAKSKGPQRESAETEAGDTETAPPITSTPAGGKAEPPSPPASAKPESAAGREEEVVPMTMLRRTVARRLVEARQTMALLTTFGEVDMSAVQVLRKEHQSAFEQRYQVKLGLMSFFVKAVVDALKQFPQLNAEVRDTNIVYHNYFDIGVAIATERGLVVPVMRNAERLSFAELEQAIGDFARRAKDGKLKPDELEGGTFTITNGGVFGSLLSTPIINPPQTGILGLHTIQERPVAVQGQVVIRPMMYAALTYDHRLVDGREAVLFLRRVKEVIETPARMLVEI